MKPKPRKIPEPEPDVCPDCHGVGTCPGMRCSGPAEVEAERLEYPEDE